MAAHAQARRQESPARDPRRQLLDLMPIEERRHELAGIPTAVLVGGSGPPLVLLHGPGEHATKWFRIVAELTRTWTVIAPDLPAHGASGLPPGALDADAVLAWIDALVTRTCRQQPVLIGQIVGGAIAARFAARQPGRVAHLVLSDALGLAPFQPAPDFGAALQAFLGRPDPGTHDDLWAHCAYDLDRLRAQLGEAWSALKAYNLDRAAVARNQPAQMALMQQFGFPPIDAAELGRIACPVSLVWGRNDLATALSVAQQAAERFGWALQVIDDCGDDPPMEQPQAFLAALSRALGS